MSEGGDHRAEAAPGRWAGCSTRLKTARRPVLLLSLLLVVSLAIRLPFIDVPLERDEGVRAVVTQGVLEGQLPYRDLFTNKPPGIVLAYGLIFRVLGTSVAAIHLGLYLYSLAAIAAMFFLALGLTRSHRAALVAALALSVATMSPRVYGTAANLEQFMALPAVLAVISRWRGLERRSTPLLVLAGACAGSAMLLKQAGVFTLLSLLGAAVYELAVLRACTFRRFLGSALAVIGGAVLVLAVALLALWRLGIAEPALRWTLLTTLPGLLTPSFSAARFLRRTLPIVIENPAVYALAAAGLIAALARRSHGHGVLLSWTAFSTLALFPGMAFLPHYYILLLLPLSLASGLGVEALHARLAGVRAASPRRAAWVALAALALAAPLRAYLPYLKAANADATSRLAYPRSFFPEARQAGAYIGEQTRPDDTVLVVGNEPEICFYAGRRSATAHIGCFYLFRGYRDEATMQRSAWQEIVRNGPAFIVRFYTAPSLEVAAGAGTWLLDEIDRLIARRYALDGLGVVASGDPTVRRCVFGAGAGEHAVGPDEQVFMRLFRRVDQR